MMKFISSFFQLDERGTDLKTELIAGIATFLTMMYIVPLNGIIMSKAGMPIDAVMTATAMITILAFVI